MRRAIKTVENILTLLNPATKPQALDLPRYRLPPAHGRYEGLLDRDDGNAEDVEQIDYYRKEKDPDHEKCRSSRPYRPPGLSGARLALALPKRPKCSASREVLPRHLGENAGHL